MNIYEKLKKFFNISFQNISLFNKNYERIIKEKISIKDLEKSLYQACTNNDLKKIENITINLLINPNKENLGSIFNTAIGISAWNNKLTTIKYFIESEAVEYINTQIDSSLVKFACKHDSVDILHYLINDPKVKYKLNINKNREELFIQACKNNNLTLAQYLIFQHHLKKNEKITNFFLRNPHEEIEKMFDLRDLNELLTKELGSDKVHTKKSKL